MEHAGRAGNNDGWHLNLGRLHSGARVSCAVEVVDGAGATRWLNDGGNDYRARVN